MKDFKLYKDGQRILIAYNLHKNCFSVRDFKTKIVLGYEGCIVLSDVKFVVSAKGRERVLRERKKNLHAYICGYYYEKLQNEFLRGFTDQEQAYYNPYKTNCFINKRTKEPLITADIVFCINKDIYYIG